MSFCGKLLNAIESGCIEDALESMVERDPDVVGSQVFHFNKSDGLQHCATIRVDPQLVALMEANYLTGDRNPVVRDLSRAKLGKLAHLSEVSSYEAYLKSAVYSDFSQPAGAKNSGIMLDPGMHGTFMYSLGTSSDWLTDAREEKITYQFQQIGRVLDLFASRQAHQITARNVLLLDERLRPIFAQDKQLQYLQEIDFMIDREGSFLPEKADMLQCWVKTAKAAFKKSTAKFCFKSKLGEIVAIQISKGPVLAYGATLVCQIDRPAQPFWSAKLLMELFQLTAREADIALGLTKGKSLAQISESLGIKTTSGRVYLKRVFEKTNTNSQGQMIAFLHSRNIIN